MKSNLHEKSLWNHYEISWKTAIKSSRSELTEEPYRCRWFASFPICRSMGMAMTTTCVDSPPVFESNFISIRYDQWTHKINHILLSIISCQVRMNQTPAINQPALPPKKSNLKTGGPPGLINSLAWTWFFSTSSAEIPFFWCPILIKSNEILWDPWGFSNQISSNPMEFYENLIDFYRFQARSKILWFRRRLLRGETRKDLTRSIWPRGGY